MNKIDSLELELKARKMVEGIELNWWNVIRNIGDHYFNPARFIEHPRTAYELALGIIEVKPVWEGDIIYTADGKACRAQRHYEYPGSWSWNPPAPKTAMVELPVEVVEDAAKWEPGYSSEIYSTIGEACRKALENQK